MSLRLLNNDVIRMRIFYHQVDQEAVNTMHFVISASTGLGITMNELLVAMDGAYTTALQLCQVQTAFLRSYSGQRIQPAPLTLLEFFPIGTAGTAGADPLPGQVSGLIAFGTDLAGPSQRARLYIPFPDQSLNDPLLNRPSVAGLTLYAGLVALLSVPLGVTGAGGNAAATPVIWHRATSTYAFITSGTARDAWATQKRRGNYGRTNPVYP